MEPKKIPASPTTLAPLIVTALKTEGGPLRRKDLIGRVASLAHANGFMLTGDIQGISAMKKALRQLKDEGTIFNPQPKWWQVADRADADCPTDPNAGTQGSLDEDLDEEELSEEVASAEEEKSVGGRLRVEHSIGEGPESVYRKRPINPSFQSAWQPA
jgi:hypothetical protein